MGIITVIINSLILHEDTVVTMTIPSQIAMATARRIRDTKAIHTRSRTIRRRSTISLDNPFLCLHSSVRDHIHSIITHPLTTNSRPRRLVRTSFLCNHWIGSKSNVHPSDSPLRLAAFRTTNSGTLSWTTHNLYDICLNRAAFAFPSLCCCHSTLTNVPFLHQ